MWELHAIIVKKGPKMTLEKAKQIGQEFIKNPNKHFVRETTDSYRVRARPKTQFSKFRTKVINENITLVYGELKNI